MNERIKKLAEQAKLKTELWNSTQPFVIYKEDVFHPGGLEKFAELIVQECIDIIAPYSVRMIKPGEQYLHPIQEIKETFRS
jgi:hypothetical protein